MIYPLVLIIICWSFIMFIFATAIPFIFRGEGNDTVDIRSLDWAGSLVLSDSTYDNWLDKE